MLDLAVDVGSRRVVITTELIERGETTQCRMTASGVRTARLSSETDDPWEVTEIAGVTVADDEAWVRVDIEFWDGMTFFVIQAREVTVEFERK